MVGRTRISREGCGGYLHFSCNLFQNQSSIIKERRKTVNHLEQGLAQTGLVRTMSLGSMLVRLALITRCIGAGKEKVQYREK